MKYVLFSDVGLGYTERWEQNRTLLKSSKSMKHTCLLQWAIGKHQFSAASSREHGPRNSRAEYDHANISVPKARWRLCKWLICNVFWSYLLKYPFTLRTSLSGEPFQSADLAQENNIDFWIRPTHVRIRAK